MYYVLILMQHGLSACHYVCRIAANVISRFHWNLVL